MKEGLNERKKEGEKEKRKSKKGYDFTGIFYKLYVYLYIVYELYQVQK